MDEMDEYVQDMLDLIEWANGDPTTSKWASMRAEAGHPEPFGLESVTTLQGERDYKNGQGQHFDTDVKPTVCQERLPKRFTRELPPYSFTVITY